MFIDNLQSTKIYNPDEIEKMIELSMNDVRKVTKRRHKKSSIHYYDCPCAFDIETTSFFDANHEKASTMYVWMLGLNGLCMMGRTWEEFINVINTISGILELDENNRIIVGVHNLGYEFQFIRHYFEWEKVFSVDIRKPVYAITTQGIEFRDTYILSGYKLETVGKNLHTYKVEKMVGDLDYTKIRNSKTKLTKKEIGYCINDIKVVMAYIQECIDTEGTIIKIPLTKTGYIRRYVKNACYGLDIKEKNYKKWDYMTLIQNLTLDPEEYIMLKRAFCGGFTHASPFYSGKICSNVMSMDLTSSYPTQLCLPKFPMSKGEKHTVTSKKDFEESIKLYCCLFDIELENVESKFMYDAYISRSRCIQCVNPIMSNGRVVSADRIVITITEQDYNIIKNVYTWDKIKIGKMIRYKRGYLPKDFVRSVLELYKNKTELKGLEGDDKNGVPYSVTYLSRKEMLNACFGMTVTDIVRSDIIYVDDWAEESPDLNEEIEKYNTNRGRFLYYPWGVWTTACARTSVWSAIFNLKDDYIYSDTDSVKFMHPEKHMDYFEKYNRIITEQLNETCKHFGFPEDYVHPKNNKGKEKQLGIWDFDGIYQKFKTLGAKRYMLLYADDPRNGESSGKYSLTVSGLNKKITLPYLLKKYGSNIFKAFSDGLYIPNGYTGKNTHTYIDDVQSGYLTDYQGNVARYHEYSSIHLGSSDYSLSISQEYINFLLNII
jgi:hypothetical protein